MDTIHQLNRTEYVKLSARHGRTHTFLPSAQGTSAQTAHAQGHHFADLDLGTNPLIFLKVTEALKEFVPVLLFKDFIQGSLGGSVV